MIDTTVQIWLGVGLTLIVLELILPGGVVVFLGISAIAIGGALHLGWIETFATALSSWFILSLLNLLLVRNFFMKYFAGDTSVQSTDEDADDIGKIVIVIEDIFPHKEGRIRFKESTWGAQSEAEIKKNEKAIIINRKGNKYVVGIIEE